MAEHPYLPLWTDAYLADTTDLSAEEHGVYLLLLMAAWRSPDCTLPDDDERLARMARVGTKKWRKLRPVMERFFTVSDQQWTQNRLLKERDRIETSRDQKRQAAQAKWRKNNESGDAVASNPDQSPQTLTRETRARNPEPEPEKNTHPNGCGIKAADDPAKQVFDLGVSLLTQAGVKERQARTKLGQWRRDHGDGPTLNALIQARHNGAVEPISYVEQVLRNGSKVEAMKTREYWERLFAKHDAEKADADNRSDGEARGAVSEPSLRN